VSDIRKKNLEKLARSLWSMSFAPSTLEISKLESAMISLFHDTARWDSVQLSGKKILDELAEQFGGYPYSRSKISKEILDLITVPSTFMFLSPNGTVITTLCNMKHSEQYKVAMEHTGIILLTLWKYLIDNSDADEEKIKNLFLFKEAHGYNCSCCVSTNFEDLVNSPKLFSELSMDEVFDIISDQKKFSRGHNILGNFMYIARTSRIVYDKNNDSRVLGIDSYELTDAQIDFFLKFIPANKISPENIYILDRSETGTLSKQLGLNKGEGNTSWNGRANRSMRIG